LLKSGDSIKKSQQELANDTNLYRVGHPLAKQIIKVCKNKELKNTEIIFNYSSHPIKMVALEKYIGQSGFLQVSQLSIISFEAEDYLIINAIDQNEESIDVEIAKKLFNIPASISNRVTVNQTVVLKLAQLHKAQKQDVLEENMQRNAEFFDQEYDKLDRWADDMKISLEREIKDLDAEIKLRKAEARKKLDLQTKVKEQRAVKELEKKRNEKRKTLFEAQDQIDTKKDDVLSNIEERLNQKIEEKELFTIKWKLI
jgi:hypothetical protein